MNGELTKNELVLYSEDGVIKSAGYNINSILLNNQFHDQIKTGMTIPIDLVCVNGHCKSFENKISQDDGYDPLDDVIHDQLIKLAQVDNGKRVRLTKKKRGARHRKTRRSK